MPFKNHAYYILLLILIFCILVVTVSVILHQLPLLYYLVFGYWFIWALLWGIPLIYAGVREQRKARQNGERAPWLQNKKVVQGMSLVLPPLVEWYAHLSNFRYPYSIENSDLLILDIVVLVVMLAVLVFMLFLEIVLTVGFIRVLLRRANPYAHIFLSVSIQEPAPKEQKILKRTRGTMQW